MDLTTVLGIVIAVAGLILGVLMGGGNLAAYIGVSAFVIIAGGTLGATVASFPLHTVMTIPRLLIIAFTEQKFDVAGLITMLVNFSERARREGILSLEAEQANIKDEFLKQGIQLVVDGTDPAIVRDTLETKVTFIEERHEHGAKVFETAGGYAPTMGIIGTVLGLINVLSNIAEASKLAGAIALAFIATLYGIFSANVLWLPIANKLKAKTKEEILVKGIMLEGILCLQSGENPRMVEQKLKSFLSQSEAKHIQSATKK